jgi:hypothetical protein
MTTLSESIAVLAATAPPRKLIFNVGVANRRINELEARLGLPSGKDFFNIGKANARVKELEAKLAGLKTLFAAQPASVAPAAPLTALAKAVFGTDAEETFEAQRLQFTRAGLSVPGLTPAPDNPHYTARFVGLARSVRADRQAKIDAFFNPKH